MCKNEKGWILVDVLIGFIILSIALVGMAVAFRQSVLGTVFANNHTKAAYFAQEQLSNLRRYDHTGLDRDSVEWTTSSTRTDPNQNSQLQFTVSSSKLPDEQIPVGLDIDIIPVQVTIQWNESTGLKTFTVITYYYK